jgi:hypothetical protein
MFPTLSSEMRHILLLLNTSFLTPREVSCLRRKIQEPTKHSVLSIDVKEIGMGGACTMNGEKSKVYRLLVEKPEETR